ncbi:MAG: acyltransferase [Syntrophales bacterium LBB04]|nr:acyltransferase [Syntrophales bacterium LBB04]
MEPIISPNVRVRCPEFFIVDKYSIIDDFCYFSTKVRIGISSHIASGCSIAGGSKFTFEMGDFSSLSSGVKIFCASNDFVNDLVVITPSGLDLKEIHPIEGDVLLGHYTGIGANSVVMPKNLVPEGTVIGALSFVPPSFPFEPWSVYAGSPIRFIGKRNRDNVMRQIEKLRNYICKEKEDGANA